MSLLPETTKTKIKVEGYPAEMEFIQSRAFATAFVAGKGSGKTHSLALKRLVYSLENPGSWAMITAPNYRILEIATLPTYQRIFPPELIKKQRMSPHPEWELVNGCKFFFWSTDKPETIAGGEIASADMDEAALSPYLAYWNIRSRLRQKNLNGVPYPYQVNIATTPRQLNWLYKEFITQKRDEYKLIQACTKDNVYLGDVEEYIQRLGVTGKQYEQDVEGKFLSLAGDCLFRGDILTTRLNDCISPMEVRYNGLIQIWKSPVVGVEYIAGADCADEGGEGVNCMIIMEKSGEEVAQIYGDISADRFSKLADELGREYNNCLLAVERNGTVGGLVTAKLEALKYPKLYKDDKGKIGWYTHTTAYPPKVSRFTMLSEYEEAVRTRQTIVRSSDAIGEMSRFVRSSKDKYEHLPEYKDDMIMARAICWQMRKQKSSGEPTFRIWRRPATVCA